MLKVYLSGPISQGNRAENLRQADEAFMRLRELGYAVLNPMWSARMPGAFDIPHARWIENDLAWVECADAVLRLPGESVGAEIECDHARRWGIPVYDSIADLEDDCFGECEEPFDETDLPL